MILDNGSIFIDMAATLAGVYLSSHVQQVQ
jgi:hypothetical protein